MTINTDSGVTKAQQNMNANVCNEQVAFQAFMVFNEIDGLYDIKYDFGQFCEE